MQTGMLSFGINDEEINPKSFKFLREPESIMMAIRLETYLSKLK